MEEQSRKFHAPDWAYYVLIGAAEALQLTLATLALIQTSSSPSGAIFGIPLVIVTLATGVVAFMCATRADIPGAALLVALGGSGVTALMMLGRFMFHRFGDIGLVSVPLGILLILSAIFVWATWRETRKVRLNQVTRKFR